MNVVRQEIRTGLLVVLALVALVFISLYVGATGGLIPRKTYYVDAENVQGIEPGADVTLAGRKVGRWFAFFTRATGAETIDSGQRTRIKVRVDRNAGLYRDVRVRLTSNGLLGTIFVDFSAGVPSSGEAENGHVFLASRDPGLGEVAPVFLERLESIIKEMKNREPAGP